MKEPIYLDTSALAKWYLNEARSDDFAAFVVGEPRPIVSRLTAVEIRSLLERRRRSHQITTAIVRKVVATFERDVRDGHLEMHALEDAHAILAGELLHRLAQRQRHVAAGGKVGCTHKRPATPPLRAGGQNLRRLRRGPARRLLR